MQSRISVGASGGLGEQCAVDTCEVRVEVCTCCGVVRGGVRGVDVNTTQRDVARYRRLTINGGDVVRTEVVNEVTSLFELGIKRFICALERGGGGQVVR